MGRIRGLCKITDCKNRAKSLGNRSGKPFYGNFCSYHRKSKDRVGLELKPTPPTTEGKK